MSKEAFYKLFLNELKDIYSAEIQLVRNFPQIISASNSPELREALERHYNETKNQVARLEKIFTTLKENYQGTTCPAMREMINEFQNINQQNYSELVKDAALISAAQSIEHYEMSRYGALRTWAKQLELPEIANLLQESLDEEGHANKALTDIAVGGFFTSGVNKRARKA